MKVSITFTDGKPVMSIGGLEGMLMILWGRTEHIVSRNPMDDTLSTTFRFFIAQEGNGWRFDYKSNCKYTHDEDRKVIDDLLAKANGAIIKKRTTDLSREFNALNNLEPYDFGGLFSQMNERRSPKFENDSYAESYNEAIAKMREELESRLTRNVIESDEHLNSFVFQIPLETICVDDTTEKE